MDVYLSPQSPNLRVRYPTSFCNRSNAFCIETFLFWHTILHQCRLPAEPMMTVKESASVASSGLCSLTGTISKRSLTRTPSGFDCSLVLIMLFMNGFCLLRTFIEKFEAIKYCAGPLSAFGPWCSSYILSHQLITADEGSMPRSTSVGSSCSGTVKFSPSEATSLSPRNS